MTEEMKIRFRQFTARTVLCGAVAMLLGCLSTAHAELTVVEKQTDAGYVTIYRLDVTPAPEPQPPLRHRLAVREIEMKPGNAATHYLRAFPDSGFERIMKRMVDKYGDEFHDWNRSRDLPLGKLPLEKARSAAEEFDSVVRNYIAPATLRRDCEWGLEIEEMRGPDVVTLLLPEFNASRSVARALTLRTRVAIAEGDYDKALDELRMIYRLAENVGGEPLLVCGLIGIAEASMGHQQVIELIGAKDSPNLYWALAELPQPLVDIRKSIQFEMSLGLRIFPFLLDAETANHSPEEWARMMATAISDTGQLTDSGMKFARTEMKQAAVAGLSLLVYPSAKQRLISGGMAAQRVEAMPVGQVIAIDAAREYRRMADEVEKWTYVPYHVARQRDRENPFEARGAAAAASRGFGYVLASLLLPAVDAVRTAGVRHVWQTRALQIVEAVRMHAAVSGTLPDSLDDIEVVPIPFNPVTNRPYQYRLDDETAVLDLPFSDGIPGVEWRFEITLADGDRE